MISRKEIFIAVSLFVLISIGLTGKNFFYGDVFNHGDLSHPYFLKNFINNYLYLFVDNPSLSNMESVNRGLLLLPISLILNIFGVVKAKFVYAIFFTSLLFASQLNFYLFAKKVFRIDNNLALIISSVFYAFSPWVTEQYQAFLFWCAYAFLPLLILFAFEYFESRNIKYGFFLALVLTLIGTTPHYLLFAGLILFAALIYHWSQNGYGLDFYLKTWKGIMVFFLSFISLNSSWIVPVIKIFFSNKTITPGYDHKSDAIDVFSGNIGFYKVFQGMEQWVYWYKNDQFLKILDNNLWIIASFLPFFLLLYLYYKRIFKKYRSWNLFVLLFFIFFIFSLGPILPFYKWLVLDAPIIKNIGWMFRVPGKFNFFIWFFVSVVICLYLSNVKNKIVKFLVILLLMFFILPKPLRYFTFYYSTIGYPQEYLQLSEYLERTNNKTMFLAPYAYGFSKNKSGYETSFTWNENRNATNIVPISIKSPSVGYYHLTFRNWQNTLYRAVYPEFIPGVDPNENIPSDVGKKYLAGSNIEYLVFSNDIVGAKEAGDIAIKKLFDTDLIFEKKFGNDIYLFRNPYVKPILFSDECVVRYEKIDPTKYVFNCLAGKDGYIYFAQAYDNYWQMTSGNKKIQPQESDSELKLIKFKIHSGFNGGEIYYEPQTYYRYGLYFSVFGLVVLAWYFSFFRK